MIAPERAIAAKQRQLTKLVARLQQADAHRADLVAERATLLRELIALGGHGMGAKLARQLGVKPQRIDQMAHHQGQAKPT